MPFATRTESVIKEFAKVSFSISTFESISSFEIEKSPAVILFERPTTFTRGFLILFFTVIRPSKVPFTLFSSKDISLKPMIPFRFDVSDRLPFTVILLV